MTRDHTKEARKEEYQGKQGRLPREARKITKGSKEDFQGKEGRVPKQGKEGSQPREGRKMTIRAVQNNSGMSDEAFLLRRLLGRCTDID